VTQGSNRLTTLSTLAADIRQRIDSTRRLGTVPAFWDGQTAGRICDSLLTWGRDSGVPGDPASNRRSQVSPR
jgi:hypothetical protein